jgi:hypothetical protein
VVIAILLTVIPQITHSRKATMMSAGIPTFKAGLMTVVLLTWYASARAGIFDFYHPIKVAVYDAETDAPIPDATVSVHYLGIYLLGRPESDPATTDDKGMATIWVAAGEHPMWWASAKRHLNACEGEPNKDVRVFRLYKSPRPQIAIVVPNGYRGPVKIDMRLVGGRVQENIGKRDFVFRASRSGYVAFDATPLLLETEDPIDLKSNIVAVHDDGSRVREDDYRLGSPDVGLRWVADGGDGRRFVRRLYVIGTYADKLALHATIERRNNNDPHHIAMDYEALDALFTQPPAVPKESSVK